MKTNYRETNQRNLLNHLKCANTELAIQQLDRKGLNFVASVGRFLALRGYITDKQRAKVISFVSSYTSTRCTIEDKPRIASVERRVTTRKTVKHNFKALDVLATRDLPFAQKTKHLMEVHNYNDHSIVLQSNASGKFYKVHRPEGYTSTTSTYAYVTVRKTAHKGFLTIKAI